MICHLIHDPFIYHCYGVNPPARGSTQVFRLAWQVCTWYRLCIVHQWVHYQRIISNIILQFPYSPLSKLNNLQSGQPTGASVIILQYRVESTELWLTFPSVFNFLGVCSVYHLQASKSVVEIK